MSCKGERDRQSKVLAAASRIATGGVDGAAHCLHPGCDQPLNTEQKCPRGHSQCPTDVVQALLLAAVKWRPGQTDGVPWQEAQRQARLALDTAKEIGDERLASRARQTLDGLALLRQNGAAAPVGFSSLGSLWSLADHAGSPDSSDPALSPADLRRLADQEQHGSLVRERLLLMSLQRGLREGDMPSVATALTMLGDDAAAAALAAPALDARHGQAGRAIVYYNLAIELARQLENAPAENYLLGAVSRLSSLLSSTATVPAPLLSTTILESYQVSPADYTTYYRVMALDSPEAAEMLRSAHLTREEALARVERARQEQNLIPHTRDLHMAGGVYTPARQTLHNELLAAMVGGKPSVPPGQQPTIIFTGGVPGSGKSSMLRSPVYAERLAGYVVLDSDVMKARLAQADGIEALGHHAQSYQLETDDVMARALQSAIAQHQNIVLDGSMKTAEKMLALARTFRALGYRVEVAYADLPLEKAMVRAMGRFLRGSRFVDPAYVASHDHRNRGTLEAMKAECDEWRHWNTDVPKGQLATLVGEGGRDA